MRYKDMKDAVKLLELEWDLGKKESGANGNICAWIYLMEILEETEQFVYYKENGKLIGFAGYSKWHSKKHRLKRKFYSFIKKQLYKSKKIKNLDALKRYEHNYDYLPNDMKNHFDGEVSILILDKSYRGKGIGKKLLLQVFELAKKDNMKNLQILTDESCSWEFYERIGCKKVYETTVKNEEYGKLENVSTEQAFIYEKKL